MQFAKDSFFLALRQRLASLNPQRTVTINGAIVPGILVVENLPPSPAERVPDIFYVEWGAAKTAGGNGDNGLLVSMECQISYYTLGTVPSMVDRGRTLGQMDTELLAICQPPNTEKRDYSQSPSADLGTRVFWSEPAFDCGFGKHEESEQGRHWDGRAERQAKVTLFFFGEAMLS